MARMGEKRGAYRVLVGKPEGKRPLGRSRGRLEDNIKMDLQVRVGDMAWIDLAQDRDRWRDLGKAVLILWVPKNAGNFLTGEDRSSSEEGLCSMVLLLFCFR